MKRRKITNLGLVLVLLSFSAYSFAQTENQSKQTSIDTGKSPNQVLLDSIQNQSPSPVNRNGLPPEESSFSSQTSNPDSIYTFVEKSASFHGGEMGIYEYLRANLVYPLQARELNITGRVVLSFVVEKDGSITEVNVLRKLGGGCDEEAVRVVKSMPKWVPAVQKGRDVRQRYTLPLHFKNPG